MKVHNLKTHNFKVQNVKISGLLLGFAWLIAACLPGFAQETAVSEKEADVQEEYIFYTLKGTDTLGSVAAKHLGSEEDQWELLDVNGLKNPLDVTTGVRIMIPKEARARARRDKDTAALAMAEADLIGARTLARGEFLSALAYYTEAAERLTHADYERSTHWSGLALSKANSSYDLAKERGIQHLKCKMVAKNGTVRLSSDNGATWRKFLRGQTASEKDLVKTELGATATLLLPDNSLIELSKATTIQIHVLTRKARENALQTALEVIEGEILGRIKKKRGADTFGVRTPIMNVIIRGTTIRVANDSEKQISTLGVLEGSTHVQVDAELINVDENMGILVKTKEHEVFTLLPAPPVAKRFSNMTTPTRRVSLNWGLVNEATSVLFEMAKDAEFSEIIDSRQIKGTSMTTDLLKEGTFYWRVTAVSEVNLKGQISDTQVLTVTTDLEFDVQPDVNLINVDGKLIAQSGIAFSVQSARNENSIIGYEYSWDGKTFSTYTGPLKRPIHGEHVLHVRAHSEDGAISEVFTKEFTVDAEKPVLTIKRDESNVKTTGLLNLKFETSDNIGVDRLEIRQNQAPFKAYGTSAQFNVSTLNPGVVEARVIDRVGNVSAIQKVVIDGKKLRK